MLNFYGSIFSVEEYNFIASVDCNTGAVSYSQPGEGKSLCAFIGLAIISNFLYLRQRIVLMCGLGVMLVGTLSCWLV